jgi:hypothetical protein
MPRKACTFKQSDVTRALKAATAAGWKAVRMTVKKDGVEIDERLANAKDTEERFLDNPWDEVLSNAEDKERAS